MRRIDAPEVVARLRARAEHAILDVRREGDFSEGHLFSASNIPLSQLELKIELLVPRRATPIALCAANDAEAADAVRVLAEFGYSDVAVLDGGTDGWTKAGGQLFSGINVPSKAFGEFVEAEAHTPHIAPQELKAMLDRGEDFVVLDSRPFAEYRAMNIPGAIDCPGAELVLRHAAYVRHADTLIVVNCAGRTRSIMGAQSLIDAGISNRVVALRDGTMGWQLAGFDVEHGQSRRADKPSSDAAGLAKARAAAVAKRAGVRVIGASDIDAMLGDGTRTTYVFDVRDPDEYALGHRSAAVSAPGGQLVQTTDTFAAVHNARIVVTDSEGARAPIVAAWLRQMGKDAVCAIDPSTESTLPPPTPMLDAIRARAKTITVSDAAARIADGRAIVADLANSKDYRAAHIPGALFTERAALGVLKSSRELILTSPDGKLAAVAAVVDARMTALEGGTAAWKQAGLALKSGKGNLPDNPTDVFYRPYDRDKNAREAMIAYLDWEKDLLARLAGEPGIAFTRMGKKA